MKSELEESDWEFWNDFDVKPLLKTDKKVSLSSQIEIALNEKFSSNGMDSRKVLKNTLTGVWTKEYFLEKIERLREAKEVDGERLQIMTRNAVRKVYKNRLKEMKQKYWVDIQTLTSDFYRLKQELVQKDKEIQMLTEIIADFGLKMVGKRVKARENIAGEGEDLEKMALAQEIMSLRSGLEKYKEICGILQKETHEANGKSKDLKETLQVQELQQQEVLICMKKQIDDLSKENSDLKTSKAKE